jgi:uncharacterized protein
MRTPRPGSIEWVDLTVTDAQAIRDFYAAVTGWSTSTVRMQDYSDFVMRADDGTDVAGICHARGGNADLPAQWLVYITVEDLDHIVGECLRLGGSLVVPPRSLGGGRFCVIKDPAGAVCALYQAPDAA